MVEEARGGNGDGYVLSSNLGVIVVASDPTEEMTKEVEIGLRQRVGRVWAARIEDGVRLEAVQARLLTGFGRNRGGRDASWRNANRREGRLQLWSRVGEPRGALFSLVLMMLEGGWRTRERRRRRAMLIAGRPVRLISGIS